MFGATEEYPTIIVLDSTWSEHFVKEQEMQVNELT